MRLLRLNDQQQFQLVEFPSNSIPPYAILSHTWRADGGEVTFKDISNGVASSRPGYSKLTFCAEKATAHGLQYFWIDTCCIDKSSSAELQESINSMFRWYRMAKRCYAYLADVSIDDSGLNMQPSQSSWETAFRASRWFTRGWTLQELLAPVLVEFYSREGRRLGDKRSLERQVHEITGVPISALRGFMVSEFGVEERLSWAQNRETTRDEDWAYSLLGIFGIVIPLLYGEGRDRAVMRLKREIGDTVKGTKASYGVSQISVSKTAHTPIGGNGPDEANPTSRLKEDASKMRTISKTSSNKPASWIGEETPSYEVDSDEAEGVSTREVQQHDSVQSWVSSLQRRPLRSEGHASDAESKIGLARIRDLVRDKGTLTTPSNFPTGESSSTGAMEIPRNRTFFYRQQPIPRALRRFVKRSIIDDQAHLIIEGLGASGSDMRDMMFPQNGTVDMIHEYLDKEGFGRISGFEIQTGRGSYFMGRSMPKSSITAIEITGGPSQTSIQDGYSINMNERLIDFYNSRFAGKGQLGILAHQDCIEVTDKHNRENQIYIDFKRVVRVPDDRQTYAIPAPLASFPLFLARDFSSTLPNAMKQKEGMFFTMLQREALTLAFSSTGTTESQFAIRIFTGGVNALTGQSVLQSQHSSAVKQQDYVLVPQQRLLSGYKVDNIVKQFVAMPMGDRYSVEYQSTGNEFVGGIQLEIVPALRQTAIFRRFPPDQSKQETYEQSAINLFDTPEQLGLHPGQRIFMLDRRPYGLYDFPSTIWQPANDFVEPAAHSHRGTNRPTFIHELYDGSTFERFDRSSSLLITAIPAIEMSVGPFNDGTEVSFHCSVLARISDIRRYLAEQLFSVNSNTPWIRIPNITLTIAGKTFGNEDDALMRDLNVRSPQKLGFRSEAKPRWIGAGGSSNRATGTIVPGWDLGVAMGGKLEQSIIKDNAPHIWNWKAAKAINIQILNSVAFQAVTGLFPPLSPLALPLQPTAGNSGTPEPPTIKTPALTMERLQHVKSITELDWERGAAPGICLNGDSVVLCVCCETNVCDSVMDKCGHMFCHVCIAYYMTENATPKCGFCLIVPSRVILISAQASTLPRPPKVGRFLVGTKTTEGKIAPEGIEIQDDSVESKLLQSILDDTWTMKQLETAIIAPRNERSRGESGLIQLLLGQIISRPDLISGLPIGRLIYLALRRRNKEIWYMLVPLYKLINHRGLDFAQAHGIEILETIDLIADIVAHGDGLNQVVLRLGLQRAQLLVKLGILESDSSVRHVRRVVRDGLREELKLLLSLGLDPESADGDGETLLHIAPAADVAEMLCTAGADIAALDGDRNTPISTAVAYGRMSVLEVLLRQKGTRDTLNVRNKFGKAAVHYTQRGSDIFTMLVEAGADPKLETGPKDPGL